MGATHTAWTLLAGQVMLFRDSLVKPGLLNPDVEDRLGPAACIVRVVREQEGLDHGLKLPSHAVSCPKGVHHQARWV